MKTTLEIRHQTALAILQGLLASGDYTAPANPDDPEDEPSPIYNPETGCVAINEALMLADEFIDKVSQFDLDQEEDQSDPQSN